MASPTIDNGMIVLGGARGVNFQQRVPIGLEEIADQLSSLGYRSPQNPRKVLPSTVQAIRLRHHVFQKRSQSHPRLIPGFLTVPQLTKALDLPPSWLYDRIHNGSIQISKDNQTNLYLFPDTPDTLEKLQLFKSGVLKNLRFS